MFSINLRNLLVDYKNSHGEMKSSIPNVNNGRTSVFSRGASGLSDDSTRSLYEQECLVQTNDDKIKTCNAEKFNQGNIPKNYRYHNRRREMQCRRFQAEVEKTSQKIYQERVSCREEDDEAFRFMNDMERWVEGGYKAKTKQVDEVDKVNRTEATGARAKKLKSSERNYERELQRTQRLLELEKSQKIALRERLSDVENQLNRVRRAKREEESLSERYCQRIRKLQDEIKGCRDALDKERLRAVKLETDLLKAREENAKSQEKMRLLMFHHIPSVSPRFKDIGPVDYNVEERWDRVSEYRLGKVLGEGHYGMVQVGMNIKTKENYAMKILSKDRVHRFKDLQQMATEVHVLKRYSHPNIVHLREVIHAVDNIYIVTELCMMDIHQYHSEIGLSEEGAKHVALGIIRPLEYLHSHGICHLDLKPENVLIARSANLESITYEHIRLCDFGLVNMAKNPEQSKEIYRQEYACGTPGFFAPEMILNHEFEGRIADMWSIGCIIMELTLGFTQPWIDSYNLIESDPSGFRAGLEECLSEIPREKYPNHQNLLDLMHSCLEIEPTKRINSGQALLHPWFSSIITEDENRQDSTHSRQSYGPAHQYSGRIALLAESALYC